MYILSTKDHAMILERRGLTAREPLVRMTVARIVIVHHPGM